MFELKRKTIKGIGWSFIDNIANTGITFLVGLVLARILSPSEFGIIGMLAIFIAVANTLVDSGLSSSLIRKNDTTNTDYNTIFFFNIFISTSLYVLLFLIAPSISAFFREPILVPVSRVLSLVLIINSFSIIQRTILIKRIDFKTQTKISLIASVSSGIIGIGMALCGNGLWSLVGQQVSRQLLNTMLLWVFNSWRPVFEFSKDSFKVHFGFGSKLLLSGLLDTLYKNVFNLIIGRFYQADQLGQYSRAESFSGIFSSNLTGVVQRVSYPTLSSIQDDSMLLRQAYRRVIKTTMFISFSCILGLAAVSKPMIVVLIGSKWLQAAEYLPIICLGTMLYPLHAINLNMLQVKARSDLFLRLEVLKKAIGLIPIFLGIFIGIKAMLWGGVLTSFIAYFLNSYYSGRLINYSMKEQVMDITPSFLLSLGMAVIVHLIEVFSSMGMLSTLIIQISIGVLVVIGFSELFRLKDYLYVKQLVTETLYRNRK